MKRIAKFRALPALEQRFLLLALLTLPLVWLRLRAFGIEAAQTRAHHAAVVAGEADSLEVVARWASLVRAADRYMPFPSTCLSRSLTLLWLLERRGVVAQLRVGVRLKPEGLDAHAWVEYAGVPVNDDPKIGEQFAVFAQPIPLKAFARR